MARLNEDRATRYHRARLRARFGANAATLLVLAAAGLTGAGAALARIVEADVAGTPGAWLISTLLFTSILAAVAGLARLPFDVFADWTLERRYGLERVPLSRWFGRHVRESLIGGVLLCAAAVAVRAAYVVSPVWGWGIAAFLLTLGHLGWSVAMPVVLARSGALQPLDAPELQRRLTALGRRLDVPLDVRQWHAGGARQAHAILVGLGRHGRVILSDTLLDTLSDEEIEVVVAHELAHRIHGDVWTAALWRLATMTSALGAASALLPLVAAQGAAPADLAALPAIGLIVHVLVGLAAPVGLALSRRHELRADAFALAHTRNPDALVSSMRRLAASNLVDERPTRLTRLFSSHPSVNERVRAALERAS